MTTVKRHAGRFTSRKHAEGYARDRYNRIKAAPEPGARERKRAQNKRWYDNTRADPAKWRAYLDRKAENERARRARCAPTPTSEVTA